MELEDQLRATLAAHMPDDDDVASCLTDVMFVIRKNVGATQEKLFNDLTNERAIRQAAERKVDALMSTVATLVEPVTESDDEQSSTS